MLKCTTQLIVEAVDLLCIGIYVSMAWMQLQLQLHEHTIVSYKALHPVGAELTPTRHFT